MGSNAAHRQLPPVAACPCWRMRQTSSRAQPQMAIRPWMTCITWGAPRAPGGPAAGFPPPLGQAASAGPPS